MLGTPATTSYPALLRRPHVARTVTLAAVGRLGYAMLPLLLLFTLKDAAGSFRPATLGMSLYAVSGLTMPARSRWIDRRGQRATLPWLLLGMTIPLGSIVVLTATHTHLPAAGWPALATVAGLTAPPLGPSTRAQWRAMAPEDTTTAYALDGTVEEVLWLVGPALSGVLLTVPGAVWGLATVPVLLAVGVVGLASSPWADTHDGPAAAPEDRRPSPLASRALWPVLATMLAAGTAFSLVTTGVAAVADAGHWRVLASACEVALGVGSVVGGLVWGRHHPSWRPGAHVTSLLLGWAAVVAGIAVVGVRMPTAPTLALAGAAAAPLWVLAYAVADDVVDPDLRTEASTWVTTSANLGSAVGTTAAGVIAAAFTPTAALLTAAVLALATSLTAWVAWPHPAPRDAS